MCSGSTLRSPSFPEALMRANFTIEAPSANKRGMKRKYSNVERDAPNNVLDIAPEIEQANTAKISTTKTSTRNEFVVITTDPSMLPSNINISTSEIITFGTGIEFGSGDLSTQKATSTVVLPCIFGSRLEGPVLLATGTVSSQFPFEDAKGLLSFYKSVRNLIVFVDERMTDNARNLATSHRVNAVFIVQLSPGKTPKTTEDVLSLINSVNINGVTALAGPQSLVVVQVFDKYYFYRGLANNTYLNTSKLEVGAEVTTAIESAFAGNILDARTHRIIDLNEANPVLLPLLNKQVTAEELPALFAGLDIDQIHQLEEDILSAIPQLQVLLNSTDLKKLSQTLVATLSTKVNDVVAPLRTSYISYLKDGYSMSDQKSVIKKNEMLGTLRKTTKELQKSLEPVISSLANMMSTQQTSKRTHDLKRLVRQAQIQGNVEAAKAMTFESLAGYLETHATDMGVMLLNIEDVPYRQLLGNLNNPYADASSCCDLDSRVLHLEGFDAGIIIEQSQGHHNGPLRNQSGPLQPILALPYLSQERGDDGSMLAWVCWDEFVDLASPYSVRWVEKCNDAHIAALRIVMRETLTRAIVSREYNFQPNSPEIGHLMSTLLMAAMKKLAAMRTTAPVVVAKADNTVTRLMRGLFGNLLTIAGSGLKPLSMVWQLFGTNSHNDLPTADHDWIWYETVVALYPYTGWPIAKFHDNLSRLLDKAVIRVVTKNENVEQIRQSRYTEMVNSCKLRNVQLEHSRTIVHILMRMLTTPDADVAAIAKRLLDEVPETVQGQSPGYHRMTKYLRHLADSGKRRARDDLVIASVYTKRSAEFAGLKNKVSMACVESDWQSVKELCQDLIEKQTLVAKLWSVNPGSLKIQNIEIYKDLLAADFESDDAEVKLKVHGLTRQVLGDAEKSRIAWQLGKEGQFSPKIEPLDESFVYEILTGAPPADVPTDGLDAMSLADETINIVKKPEDDFLEFQSLMQSSFITTMQKTLSAKDVCKLLGVPESAMRVFVKALNPDFVWDDLGASFKDVILDLLKNRTGRVESRPIRKWLQIGEKENNEIES